MKKGIFWKSILFFILAIFSPCSNQKAAALTEKEIQILRMFYEEEELVVSPTRHIKPISQAAENITIITYKDIEEMNAHTLTDVLNVIPGLQIEIKGGPGFLAHPRIQGSEYRHVLVLIDGIELNNLSDGIADISAIPVQNIERIEIIKGPASSAWGSSLGGVINIITKSPTELVKGTFSASYGERDTTDLRVDASGKKGKFGSYLSAGNLHSDGFQPNTSVSSNNLYAKLGYELSERTGVHITFGYNKGDKGSGEFPDFDASFDNSYEYLFFTLGLTSQVSDNSDFDVSFLTSRQDFDLEMTQLSTDAILRKDMTDDVVNGANAKFSYRQKAHVIVLGTEYSKGTLESNAITGGKQGIERWAIYANDTISLGEWCLTPGLRYDYTDTNGEFISPSLGITYSPIRDTVIRATVARGFSVPPLTATFGGGPFFIPNPDLEMEKVWSYQVGAETSALRYVWLKATVFRHEVSDAIVTEPLGELFTKVNRDKVRRQGFEIEARTAPIHNISLFAGVTFVDIEDRITGETIKNIARDTWDIGVDYVTEDFKCNLRGHYIWWNAEESFQGKYSSFVWDLNLIKTIYKTGRRSIESFFTAHNLSNASQYLESIYKNPGRWIEGGIRVIL
jgi:vitamin B12 transporter